MPLVPFTGIPVQLSLQWWRDGLDLAPTSGAAYSAGNMLGDSLDKEKGAG